MEGKLNATGELLQMTPDKKRLSDFDNAAMNRQGAAGDRLATDSIWSFPETEFDPMRTLF